MPNRDGIAADFVERRERVVTVEAGVFDTLRLHRHGELLKLHRKVPPHLHLLVLRIAFGEQHASQEQEERLRHHRIAPARAIDGQVDPFAIGGRKPGRADVGAINRKTGHDLDDDLAQRRERKVAGAAIAAGNRLQGAREDGQLAGHRASHHQALAVIGDFSERIALTAHPRPQTSDRVLVRGIDKQAVHRVQKAVAGRPRDRPVFRQELAVAQDLFSDDVERAVRSAVPRRQGRGGFPCRGARNRPPDRGGRRHGRSAAR